MNTFDVPEIKISDKFREQVTMDFFAGRFDERMTIGYQDVLTCSDSPWQEYFRDILEQVKLPVEWAYLIHLPANEFVAPHIDNETLDDDCRLTLLNIPIYPVGPTYAHLRYVDEDRGWCDHAFCLRSDVIHSVDPTSVDRLNIQVPFRHKIDKMYNFYTNGELV